MTPRHLAILARQCSDWLIARGYEPDGDWWQHVWQRQGLTAADFRRNLVDAQGEIDRGLRRQAELEAGLNQARARSTADCGGRRNSRPNSLGAEVPCGKRGKTLRASRVGSRNCGVGWSTSGLLP